MNVRWFAWLLVAPLLVACPKKEDVIVETGAGKSATDEQIDQDPLALLPGGAIGYLAADGPQLFASEFGQKLAAIASAPVPASAGFVPSRDLSKLYVGFYSMQGADFAVVATGRFNRAAIEAAADGVQQTALGAPVVKSSYAERSLYTSRNVGFTVLTAQTALLGNETGIRRTLDRIKEGRVKRSIPEWFESLAATPGAAMAMGFDLRANPLTNATRASFPFLEGMETARVLANFQPPGVNLAGTLTYPDAESAQRGAQALSNFDESIRSIDWILQLLGMPQPIRKLEAQPKDNDAQFVAELEGAGVAKLLDELARLIGLPVQPKVIPANTTPAVEGEPGVK